MHERQPQDIDNITTPFTNDVDINYGNFLDEVLQDERGSSPVSSHELSDNVESAPQRWFSARNFYKHAKQTAFLATVGAGGYATATGFAPNPEVSSSGTDALIGVNDFLRDNGETALIAVAGLSAAIMVARFKSRRVKEMLDITQPVSQGREKHWSRKILPPLLVTATAVGTGLGAEAGQGASEPVRGIVSAIGGNPETSYVVVGNKDVLPFNRSSVAQEDITKISDWAVGNDLNSTSFYMELGSAKNEDKVSNPSSAGIIALPESLLPGMTEIDAPEDTMRVITTKQFAEQGDEITVEGKPAIVVETTDTYPGLDRTSIITPVEDFQANVLHGEPPFGMVIANLESPEALEAYIQANNIDAAVIPVQEWEENYNEFWDRSVTPLSMEFMLLIGGLGAVGASFMRTSDIIRRRRGLAIQNVMGVDKDTEARAEYLRTVIDTAKATAYAATPTIGVLALTNSAQYGVSLEASAAGLGAGTILVGGSLLASTLAAGRSIRKMDSANEVR